MDQPACHNLQGKNEILINYPVRGRRQRLWSKVKSFSILFCIAHQWKLLFSGVGFLVVITLDDDGGNSHIQRSTSHQLLTAVRRFDWEINHHSSCKKLSPFVDATNLPDLNERHISRSLFSRKTYIQSYTVQKTMDNFRRCCRRCVRSHFVFVNWRKVGRQLVYEPVLYLSYGFWPWQSVALFKRTIIMYFTRQFINPPTAHHFISLRIRINGCDRRRRREGWCHPHVDGIIAGEIIIHSILPWI